MLLKSCLVRQNKRTLFSVKIVYEREREENFEDYTPPLPGCSGCDSETRKVRDLRVKNVHAIQRIRLAKLPPSLTFFNLMT